MQFRPCIDIHNGKVKQIVGGSLRDKGQHAKENFVSEEGGAFFANLYKGYELKGGHIILLNKKGTKEYEMDMEVAKDALMAYPGGLQIGGGITDENCKWFLQQGASHVIVTSFVFADGKIAWDRLKRLVEAAGREHVVLDLSCRKKEDQYYIVTDRWQKFTDVVLNEETMNVLSDYCDEFLIHGVDVEGAVNGVEEDLVRFLGGFDKRKVTYAGGVSSLDDLRLLKEAGCDRLDVTVGSALDIFGGQLPFLEVVEFCSNKEL